MARSERLAAESEDCQIDAEQLICVQALAVKIPWCRFAGPGYAEATHYRSCWLHQGSRVFALSDCRLSASTVRRRSWRAAHRWRDAPCGGNCRAWCAGWLCKAL